MIIRVAIRPAAALIGLCSLLSGALSAHAERAPQARLVHCGQSTCLRLSGHRSRPAVAIEVAGRELAVVGDRDWVAMVPLQTARAWQQSASGVLNLTYFDPQTGGKSQENVVLPPGALGRHVELASLVIRAR